MENQPTDPAVPNPAPAPAPAPPQPVANAAPAPAKKSKKGLIIGIIIAAVVVIAGAITGGIFLFRGIMDSGSAEASAFVSEISNNRLEEAYERFSPQLRDVQDFNAFTTQVNTLNLNPSCEYKSNSAEISAGSSGNTKETSGSINCDNKTFSAEFKFVEINGQYLLYMYNIKPIASATDDSDKFTTPADMDALRSIMVNREAMNCTITDPDGTAVLIQASSGWDRLFMQTGYESMLFIAGDGIYSWGEGGAMKMPYDPSYLDGVGSDIDEDGNAIDYTGYTFSCNKPVNTNFNVPTDIDFIDLDELDI